MVPVPKPFRYFHIFLCITAFFFFFCTADSDSVAQLNRHVHPSLANVSDAASNAGAERKKENRSRREKRAGALAECRGTRAETPATVNARRCGPAEAGWQVLPASVLGVTAAALGRLSQVQWSVRDRRYGTSRNGRDCSSLAPLSSYIAFPGAPASSRARRRFDGVPASLRPPRRPRRRCAPASAAAPAPLPAAAS